MAKTKKARSAGRFGARYGRRVRVKIAELESTQRKKQTCPFCKIGRAVRLSKGIWECQKCSKKFASHAYFLPKQETTEKEIAKPNTVKKQVKVQSK